MSYKDLNVYQRAYKVAIDLHRFLEKSGGNFTTDEIHQLKGLSRSIIGNIAEGFSQRTSKAKRFFNFKALDNTHTIMMDLDFLHDTRRIPEKQYEHFYNEYDVCARQLYKFNQSILESTKESASANASADVPAELEKVAV
jgi:four helix bundle protein